MRLTLLYFSNFTVLFSLFYNESLPGIATITLFMNSINSNFPSFFNREKVLRAQVFYYFWNYLPKIYVLKVAFLAFVSIVSQIIKLEDCAEEFRENQIEDLDFFLSLNVSFLPGWKTYEDNSFTDVHNIKHLPRFINMK